MKENSGRMRNRSSSTRKIKAGFKQAPFIKFCSQHREQVKKELAKEKGIDVEELIVADTGKELGRRWNALSTTEKLAYKSPSPKST